MASRTVNGRQRVGVIANAQESLSGVGPHSTFSEQRLSLVSLGGEAQGQGPECVHRFFRVEGLLEEIIGSRARVAEILGRKRELSMGMIRRLHARLGISAEVLIRPIRKDAA